MHLSHLTLANLRNLHPARLEFDPSLNLIVGPNASGKTSLLEAIYLLGRAQSFRTPHPRPLIQNGRSALTVSGCLLVDGREHRLGVGFEGGRRRLRFDGRELDSRAELLRLMPVRIIDPTLYDLPETSPHRRRRFLDWGVFYFDPDYLTAWRTYRRALQQRNAALKAGDAEGATLWGQSLGKYGKMVSRSRQRYLQAFSAQLRPLAEELGLGKDAGIRYLPGWRTGADLDTVLREDLPRDLRHGCTHSGSHRDDFRIVIEGHDVRQRLSRGQMKLLAHALISIQGTLLERPGILLIDDLASELDQENQALLSELSVQTQEQIFITATRSAALTALTSHPHHMFHVEHGRISPAEP
ncbi:DNA replication and repair protein RecF [Methylomarinovum tepidoasis]|uniref:DNA replication and repair protein RecF n=1 Tax=Methylomarinovum tepidoasis TaxID=2840183 RepID=A0AAU9CC29_9GAMM|nr:DNA replication/repair protein RecF [Methylomarinovum sp. IN45]BCX88306.1 DNA replication and repair protein RecF [Methylomarinovum sp. IN45]